MQTTNWNDLRYLLAIKRRPRLTEAARLLGVDGTTVSRRLTSLQATTARRLYQRQSDGRLELTESGEALAEIAERIERDIVDFQDETSHGETVSGVVRLTSVPFVINRILVPAAGQLTASHPSLRLELIAEPRDLSLTRREADMALRLARPKTGGLRVKARRVGSLSYGSYDAVEPSEPAPEPRPWITYDETMAHLPQARWMAAAIRRGDGRASALQVNDVEAALEAVAAGLGRSLLPRRVADRDSRLRKLAGSEDGEPHVRELWLLVHNELSDLPRIKAVADWIAAIFREERR